LPFHEAVIKKTISSEPGEGLLRGSLQASK